MSKMILRTPPSRKQKVELNPEERRQLNVIIDLLIPADKDFPPPSSLQLTDTFLSHLIPSRTNKSTLILSEKRLHLMLHELNASAEGNFCAASPEKQRAILKRLEYREPAIFQALWTLVNHSYYTRLATMRYTASLS